MQVEIVPFKQTGFSNYFRSSDIAPALVGDSLRIIDGYGTRRGWGTPSVKSRVARLTEDVIAVSVTGWHKFTLSPVGGTYYFVCENGAWQRRRANYRTVKAALATNPV